MASSVEESEKQTAETNPVSRLFHIALAFATVFCPLVIVATLLCLFVTIPGWTIQNPPEENANLPVVPLDDEVFLTTIFSNKVTLTSSFASNIAQFAVSPFLLLFSFLVALELANRHQAIDQDVTKLLQKDQTYLFSWIVHRSWRVRNTKGAAGTRIAAFGALTSLVLTYVFILEIVKFWLADFVLVFFYLPEVTLLLQNSTKLTISDKLLQGTIGPTVQRVYNLNYVDPSSRGGFKINSTICPHDDTIPDIYDDKIAPPCSIDNSTSPWTLRSAPASYRVLATGLQNQTSDYHKEDFNALRIASDLGTFDDTQLVTHIDLVTHDQHVFYFNPMLAEEDSDKQERTTITLVNNDLERSGLDYIANTTSIVTKCSPITMDCRMNNTNRNNSSIPYHCSDIFNGDLNEIPANGLERLKGWNTTFYNFENGSPHNVSIASQLNPFRYNVTAVVDSIDIGGLIEFGDPQVSQGTIVEINNGSVGFAISCQSTVYDVTYSLVNGSIHVFNTTPADPRTAAIIKAPLQAGFGSYTLFEKAAMSVLFSEVTVTESMELAFSQTFLALAAGVYDHAPNLKQRLRADMTLTQLGKGPFLFLVVCMFLYAFVILVFTVIALSIFWRSDVRELQAHLIPKE